MEKPGLLLPEHTASLSSEEAKHPEIRGGLTMPHSPKQTLVEVWESEGTRRRLLGFFFAYALC